MAAQAVAERELRQLDIGIIDVALTRAVATLARKGFVLGFGELYLLPISKARETFLHMEER